MLLPENQWIHAPHLVFNAQRVLAGLLPFSAMVHANAYSLPSIAVELGVSVGYFEDASLQNIGACVRGEHGVVIRLNDAIEGTLYDMAALTHELGHAVVEEGSLGCSGVLRRQRERDAWLRGIYVAISRPLAEAVWNGETTAREVAGRCCVPTPIVEARVALAVTLGEVEGYPPAAYEIVAEQLLRLERWFEDGRRHGFREQVEA